LAPAGPDPTRAPGRLPGGQADPDASRLVPGETPEARPDSHGLVGSSDRGPMRPRNNPGTAGSAPIPGLTYPSSNATPDHRAAAESPVTVHPSVAGDPAPGRGGPGSGPRAR